MYSPTHCITLKYVSEKIVPFENINTSNGSTEYCGSSDIIVDLVIENNGPKAHLSLSPDTPIDQLFVIYPNYYFEEQSKITPDAVSRYFADITFPFIKDTREKLLLNPPLNALDVITRQITSSHVDNLSITPLNLSEDHYSIKLTIPNPNNLEVDGFSSEVHGHVTVDALDELPEISKKLLSHILLINKMSILRWSFKPVKPGVSRWMKFKIQPLSTSSGWAKSWRSHFISVFMNANSYPYEIKGPYNVRYDFFERIKSYSSKLAVVHERCLEHHEDVFGDASLLEIQRYKSTVDHALDSLRKHIGEYNETKIEDWRIEVSSGKSGKGRISGIREYGAFRISGSLTNAILREDQVRDVVYTWKSGRKNVCVNDESMPSFCHPMKAPRIIKCTNKTTDEPKSGPAIDLGCYPYCGNFKIAYDWKEDNVLCQYSRVIIFMIGLVSLFYSIYKIYPKIEKFTMSCLT